MFRKAFILALTLLPLRTFPAAGAKTKSPPKEPSINIIYPPEGQVLAPAAGQFILGSVSHPKGQLQINGQTVKIHREGGFLAWVKVEPGTFTFTCSLETDRSTAAAVTVRNIQAAEPPKAFAPEPLQIDYESLHPKRDRELLPGDLLTVRMKATPGHPAQFRLGKSPWLPMIESDPELGIYEGAYQVRLEDALTLAPVEFRLGDSWGGPKTFSPGKVTLLRGSPRVFKLTGTGTLTIKAAPNKGALFFSPPGTLFVAAGRAQGEVKAALTRDLSGWIDEQVVEFLPEGTPPPQAVVRTISTEAGPDSSFVLIRLSEKVPYSLEPDPQSSELRLKLFHSVGHVNWIIYGKDDAFIKEVLWKQESEDVVAIRILLDPLTPLWGYHTRYVRGELQITLRPPPRFAKTGSVFRGRKVFLDPGHMPSAPGFTGPTGAKEMDVNYAIAKAAERMLRGEGAQPLLSRGHDEEVSLARRPAMAWKQRADVFVSIHNNALPDGVNPFSWPRGFSVFYYQPQSRSLARDIYSSFEDRIPLPGENLRYGNLKVTRTTEMPAVLVEAAYMLLPEQEAMLKTPSFQNRIARAIVEGLRANWEGVRDLQRGGSPKFSGKKMDKTASSQTKTTSSQKSKARKKGR